VNDQVDELLAIERELMRQSERCNSTPIGRELERVFREAAAKVADLRSRLQVSQTRTQDT
jgi:hypothetical protein